MPQRSRLPGRTSRSGGTVRCIRRHLTYASVMATIAVAATIGAAPAAAHEKVFPTSITVEGTGSSSNSEFLFSASGHLNSPKAKCLSRRTVKLFLNYGTTTRTLKDVDLSSLNGEWGVRGEAPPNPSPDSYTIKVLRKRVDRRLGPRHRHVCAPASLTNPFFVPK
jgi:hypothetical protein